MELTVLDRSNYFRGLLLLAAKDNKLTESEINIMRNVGSSLGFDKTFSEESINNLLENEHISDDPPQFSSENISKNFLKDGIKLALADTELAPEEIQWLLSVAALNKINSGWFSAELKNYITKGKYDSNLEIISV